MRRMTQRQTYKVFDSHDTEVTVKRSWFGLSLKTMVHNTHPKHPLGHNGNIDTPPTYPRKLSQRVLPGVRILDELTNKGYIRPWSTWMLEQAGLHSGNCERIR